MTGRGNMKPSYGLIIESNWDYGGLTIKFILFTDDMPRFHQKLSQLRKSSWWCLTDHSEKSYIGLTTDRLPVAVIFEIGNVYMLRDCWFRYEMPPDMFQGASPDYFIFGKAENLVVPDYRVYPINIPLQRKIKIELLEWRRSVEQTARRRGVQRNEVITTCLETKKS